MRADSRVAVTMALVAALSACTSSVPSRSASYVAPRTADGVPDLNGVWQTLNTANYDIQAHPARPALAIIPAALRSGTPPEQLGGVADDAMMKRVTRADDYSRWGKYWL